MGSFVVDGHWVDTSNVYQTLSDQDTNYPDTSMIGFEMIWRHAIFRLGMLKYIGPSLCVVFKMKYYCLSGNSL